MDIKVSYKVIPSLLMGIIRDSQNSKFLISVQYLKKEVRDGVHFYKASVLVFDGSGQACPRYPK